MNDDASGANIEWKNKKGFGEKNRLSRKINIKKAIEYDVVENNSPQKAFTPKPSELPKGLRRIRKKIKDIYDDDEDEEEYVILPQDNSLLNALYEEEKQQLKVQETLNTNKQMQDVGKMEALNKASEMTKNLGLKPLKESTINNNMLDVTQNTYTFDLAIKEDLQKKTNLKTKGLSEAQTINLMRGIDRIQKTVVNGKINPKALEGWKLEELIEAGNKNMDEQQLAEMINEKTGRPSKKKNKNQKTSKNIEMQKNTKVQKLLQEKESMRF